MKKTEFDVKDAIRDELSDVLPKLAEQWRMEEQEDDPLDLDLGAGGEVVEPEAGTADIEMAGEEVVDEPAADVLPAEEEPVEVQPELDVPESFPNEGVQTVIEAMINMGVTSAIRDMSDDLSGSYPELEDLSLDIQLRLLQTLASPEAISSAAKEISDLVQFGRENLISDVEE